MLYKKAGNDYKLTPYKSGPDNICKLIKEDELFYPALHAHTTNYPPIGTCDFTKGITYELVNYLPELSNVPPVFQSGDYMIECKMTKAGEFIQGYKVYLQVHNIPSAGK